MKDCTNGSASWAYYLLLDLEPVDPVLYQRCLRAVWRLSAAKRISEQELRRAAALDFQGTSEFNVFMVQLVRERVLMPIEQSPFRFAIQWRNWMNPESVFERWAECGRGRKMQSVNGADESHATVASLPPLSEGNDAVVLPEGQKLPDSAKVSTDVSNKLPPGLFERLKAPLPAEAVSPNPARPGLSVIKVIYVVERLNEVFGLNGWHVANHVVESSRMVVVKAVVTVPAYGIEIEQFGGNDNPDRGDAYKGACTDALSKCASYLGVGMDVYKGLHDHRPPNGAGHHVNGTPSSPTPSRNGRLVSNRAASRNGAPTGLTSRNMAARFSSLRGILGAEQYEAILGQHGFREVTNISSIEDAHQVYGTLLNAFRLRFGESLRVIGKTEYAKIIRELRLNPRARLNPDQAVRVFNHIQETLNAKE